MHQAGFPYTSVWYFKTSATRSISPIMQHHRSSATPPPEAGMFQCCQETWRPDKHLCYQLCRYRQDFLCNKFLAAWSEAFVKRLLERLMQGTCNLFWAVEYRLLAASSPPPPPSVQVIPVTAPRGTHAQPEFISWPERRPATPLYDRTSLAYLSSLWRTWRSSPCHKHT